LREVIVEFYVSDNEVISDNLRKKICDCGWTVKVTRLERSEEDEDIDYQAQ